jgi:hypothetical protein
MIYFAQIPSSGDIKIGYSSNVDVRPIMESDELRWCARCSMELYACELAEFGNECRRCHEARPVALLMASIPSPVCHGPSHAIGRLAG